MKEFPKRIPVLQDFKVGTPILVTHSHIDTNGHVNNSQYVIYAIDACKWTGSIKYIQVEYKKGAKLGDVIIPRITKDDGKTTIVLMNESQELYSVVSIE